MSISNSNSNLINAGAAAATAAALNHNNSVVLDNVDDYLAPSQACINPLFQPKSSEQSEDFNSKKEDNNSQVPQPATAENGGSVVVPRRRRRRHRIQPQQQQQQPPLNDNSAQPNQETTTMPSSPKAPAEETKSPEDVIKASMADCLACSGCVTTAETVMIEQQHSLTSLRDRLQPQQQPSGNGGTSHHHHRVGRVITLSPNSWGDMCRYWHLHEEEENNNNNVHYYYYAKFAALLCQILSAHVIVDGNVPLQWTWREEAKEFCHAYRTSASQQNDGVKDDSLLLYPSVAIDSRRTQLYQADGTTKIETASSIDNRHTAACMPLISGSCPALVCLVEKTLPQLVPHLSKTISPMSIVGMVLKDTTNAPPSLVRHQWDHWAIMPCHDKKLEASRKDFYLSDKKQQCVDLAISTKECVELVEEWVASQQQQQQCQGDKIDVASYLKAVVSSDISCSALQPKDLAVIISDAVESTKPTLIVPESIHKLKEISPEGSVPVKQMAFASGGHANYIFLNAAKELFNCDLEEVEWKAASPTTKVVKSARLSRQRKLHYYEAKLFRQADGSYNFQEGGEPPVLHFAIAHGMQTMQRALKVLEAESSNLHYLEAMACPHGCVNGGGSARSVSTTTLSASTMIRETPTETQARVQETLQYLDVPVLLSSDIAEYKLPQTRYHVVPPMQYTKGAAAGVQVDKIQW